MPTNKLTALTLDAFAALVLDASYEVEYVEGTYLEIELPPNGERRFWGDIALVITDASRGPRVSADAVHEASYSVFHERTKENGNLVLAWRT